MQRASTGWSLVSVTQCWHCTGQPVSSCWKEFHQNKMAFKSSTVQLSLAVERTSTMCTCCVTHNLRHSKESIKNFLLDWLTFATLGGVRNDNVTIIPVLAYSTIKTSPKCSIFSISRSLDRHLPSVDTETFKPPSHISLLRRSLFEK